MHVLAFAPSLGAVEDDGGGVTLTGFPMSSATVMSFPAQITVALVLAVYTEAGTDRDPRWHIVARAPDGARIGSLAATGIGPKTLA